MTTRACSHAKCSVLMIFERSQVQTYQYWISVLLAVVLLISLGLSLTITKRCVRLDVIIITAMVGCIFVPSTQWSEDTKCARMERITKICLENKRCWARINVTSCYRFPFDKSCNSFLFPSIHFLKCSMLDNRAISATLFVSVQFVLVFLLMKVFAQNDFSNNEEEVVHEQKI